MNTSFFSDLMQTVAQRGRNLFGKSSAEGSRREIGRIDPPRLIELGKELLSHRGEASGIALAQKILYGWHALDTQARRDFLRLLALEFGPEPVGLEEAIAAYVTEPGPATSARLHQASQSRRQELIRRIHLAPEAMPALVEMRKVLLGLMDGQPDLNALDQDFVHLFTFWFNRGFLVLRRIDWSTPANILERIIAYEAVHAINGWNDLRRRLAPPDRRLYAFFHPQLVDDPVIFVEVALTREIPGAIADVLAETREEIDADAAATAVFYSISNCQEGLRGISFGNFLIKQVVEDLRRELPKLQTFVTLSPLPGFARWLAAARKAGDPLVEGLDLSAIDQAAAAHEPAAVESAAPALVQAAARYLLDAKGPSGRPVDPVARFHLGNGARLERINAGGDLSANGLRQAHGVMVNYLYKLDEIEANHEAYAEEKTVKAAAAIRRLAQDRPHGRKLGLLRRSGAEVE